MIGCSPCGEKKNRSSTKRQEKSKTAELPPVVTGDLIDLTQDSGGYFVVISTLGNGRYRPSQVNFKFSSDLDEPVVVDKNDWHNTITIVLRDKDQYMSYVKPNRQSPPDEKIEEEKDGYYDSY